MTIARSILVGFALIALAAFPAGAMDAKETAKAEAPKKLKNQTHCPVMGGEIDSTAYTDIQGQRVYLCCPGCSASLKADPDKYFKKAAAEGVLFENIQTYCAVGGEELKDKSVYADFEGRRIAFCGAECRDAFHKDAKTYLMSIDGKPRDVGKQKKSEHEAHGHSCNGHS